MKFYQVKIQMLVERSAAPALYCDEQCICLIIQNFLSLFFFILPVIGNQIFYKTQLYMPVFTVYIIR